MRIAATTLSFLLFLFLSTYINSQTTLTVDQNPRKKSISSSLVNQSSPSISKASVVKTEKCGFAYMMQQAKAKGFDENAFESQLSTFIQHKLSQSNRMNAIITVPIVFHVVFRNGQAEGGTVNISQARINAQIAQLNNDYANLSGSAYGVAADMQIRFCAALVDPYGRTLAQAGIDRINGETLGWSNTTAMTMTNFVNYCNTTIKPNSIWDPYSYVNIWSVANTSGLLGFATFPAFSTLPGLDNSESDLNAGVVVIPGTIGSITTPGTMAPYNFGRTASHEIGHFFSLRHIWGDGVCGDDFCADTPPQDQETGGCPPSPQPNNCNPPGDKMFENYMDYSNDACLNTFTNDQATRATTVMTNSPRRITLAASSACVARAANSIQFPIMAQTVTETGTTGTCPRTKAITINLGIAGAATGAATVTFAMGGTATNNADYTISPASVTYTNGDNALKPVTITLIDDNSVESPETIQLSYTITGTGVVAGPDRQLVTITIVDDDFDHIVNNSGAVTLLTENFNATPDIPTDWVTFLDGSTNGWVVSANGGNGTTGNAAHITNDAINKTNTYDHDLNPGEVTDAYLVTPLIDATGLTNINVSFKWRCIGEVDFDEGYLGFVSAADPTNIFFFNGVAFSGQTGPDPAAQTFSGNFPASFNNSQFFLVFNWFSDEAVGEDPPFTIDDVVITAQPASIETTLNDASTLVLNTGMNVQYITPDNQIIARLSGANENLGCVTATIQNAGTGVTGLTTPTGSYLRSNKVIRLQPVTANTTASYQVTLYYTTAELAAWGGSVATLQMMKVKDGVNLAGVITGANAQIAPTTVDDQRGTKGYAAFTSSFTGGFSQFMLVSPNTSLPVNLLTFEAKPVNRSIVLNWSTAQEINNKGFGIERSADGTSFKNIGWTDGQGNTNSRTDYTYKDNYVQPGQTYHYRLRQTDIDNKEKLSVIRQAKIEGKGLAIFLSPNPARGKISLFISGSSGAADVNLVNGQGQVVKSWRKLNAVDASASLDINGLAPGIYLVTIQLPETKTVEKLVIE